MSKSILTLFDEYIQYGDLQLNFNIFKEDTKKTNKEDIDRKQLMEELEEHPIAG